MRSSRVAVLMGSDSDWKVMQACAAQLTEFGVEADVQVMSAHRTPDDVVAYVKAAGQNDIAVFVAGAGMSAALAGTIAAHTTLPVIGVPIDSGFMNGMDALLSTVQMPPGVAVAGMAVGKAGAVNAAIFAVQILALGDVALQQKLDDFRKSRADKVREANRRLQSEI